jgi:hypothetical protein
MSKFIAFSLLSLAAVRVKKYVAEEERYCDFV